MAYRLALSPSNLIASFRKTGICPFDRNAYDASKIVPHTVFKRVSGSEDQSEREVVSIDDFLQDANQVLTLPPKKRYKTLSRVVSGRAITEDSVYSAIVSHVSSKSPNKQTPTTSKTGKNNNVDSVTSVPQVVVLSRNENDVSDEEDDSVCCVCGSFYVQSARNKSQLAIVNWAQCVNGQCNHWVHLKYCTDVRHVAHDEAFLCPHCTED